MNTFNEQVTVVGRRRRKHSDEFKAQVVAACRQPGVSIAAVSMAHGVNANLARRWIIDIKEPGRQLAERQRATPEAAVSNPAPPPFVAMSMPPGPASAEIRVELRRGTTAISVTWPVAAAAECAAWMRELLR